MQDSRTTRGKATLYRAVDLGVFVGEYTKLRFESVSESMEIFTAQYYRTVMPKYTLVAAG